MTRLSTLEGGGASCGIALVLFALIIGVAVGLSGLLVLGVLWGLHELFPAVAWIPHWTFWQCCIAGSILGYLSSLLRPSTTVKTND